MSAPASSAMPPITTTAVPFLDLRAAYLEQRAAIDAAIARVTDSG